MANVRVVADGANLTTSEDFGRFSLEFPRKNPGEPVEVLVQQEGYVAVNDVQLQLMLPAKAEDKLLTIILCKEENREEMVRRFYRLKSNEAIEATYHQKLKVLHCVEYGTMEYPEHVIPNGEPPFPPSYRGGTTCRRIRYRRFSQPGGLWAYSSTLLPASHA